MNAAMSKEDATKKVEAEGMTDGAWDLDKLWKLVTQWEVGDNTVVMPIAREKFVALGKPALDRAFEHFDAKDSLKTRAIEKTLAAFPKEQWLPRLLEKTKDPDKVVRKNAVLMVTNLKVAEALPRLTEMLTTDPDTTGGVLAALAALKTAPPEVVALLKAPKESVGVQAAVCLGAVGDEESMKALASALSADHAFPVRLAAQEQLAALGAKAVPRLAAVVNPLEHLRAPPERTGRRNALRALGRTKAVEACEPIREALIDGDPLVRLSAMLAAAELLQAFPESATSSPPGGAPSVGPVPPTSHLRSSLDAVRDSEQDPLVKRLVTPTPKK